MSRARRWKRASLGAAIVFGALAAPGAASADKASEKRVCAVAHTEAQRSMRSGALRRARGQLKICAREECLAAVRKDCLAWLDEVEAGIPSIVVEAKGPDGKETLDVKVSIGDEVVAPKLDVHAIELDPGTYTLRFEREGSSPIEKEIVLRQGQRNKVVEVSFAPSAGATVAAEPGVPVKSASPDAKPAQRGDARPASNVLPYALGGVGVALVGTGVAFWVMAESTRSDLEAASCAPSCERGEVDSITSQRLVGDVLLGAGVVAIGAAAVWLLTTPSSQDRPSPSKSSPWGSIQGPLRVSF